MTDLSTADLQKSFITVNGRRMAYAEAGDGVPFVFLHGNPTSSYLWRNIMPHVSDMGRAIAPDLIGMGDSDKLESSGPERYRFVEHRDFLDAFLDQVLGGEKAFLIIHDWGSALGFHWAHRHPDRVLGICFMEAVVAPIDWDEFPNSARPIFEAFRSDAGEDLILQQNAFVEKVLPSSIIRDLGDEEMAAYRRPFIEPGEGRRPTLTWPRQLPINGEPEDVVEIVAAYRDWLAESDVPKLFINADPGAILRKRLVDLVREWPNLTEVTVPGIHFIQEDSPHEIGEALRNWASDLV